MLEIYEVYKYQVTQYNPETFEGDFSYKHTSKTERGGKRLSQLGSKPEDEKRYIHSFWDGERIDLDKAAINYNAAKRGLRNFA